MMLYEESEDFFKKVENVSYIITRTLIAIIRTIFII